MGPYSQHFIFFITDEWDQYARVLYKTEVERVARDKHCSLFCPLVSYEENEALRIRALTIELWFLILDSEVSL